MLNVLNTTKLSDPVQHIVDLPDQMTESGKTFGRLG
jgi:hypothetical protein